MAIMLDHPWIYIVLLYLLDLNCKIASYSLTSFCIIMTVCMYVCRQSLHCVRTADITRHKWVNEELCCTGWEEDQFPCKSLGSWFVMWCIVMSGDGNVLLLSWESRGHVLSTT